MENPSWSGDAEEPSSTTTKSGTNWPCQADWGGLPSDSSRHPQGARGSAAVEVRRCAKGGWLRIPCGFLPGQTRLHSPGGPSPPRTLGHAHTGPLFFLLPAALCLFLPIAAPATPAEPHCSGHAEPALGLSTATPVCTTESGCSTSTFLVGGHSFKQEPKQRIVEKSFN